MSTPNPTRFPSHSPVIPTEPISSSETSVPPISLDLNAGLIAASAASGTRVYVPEYRRQVPLLFSPLALLGLTGCQSDPCSGGTCASSQTDGGTGGADGQNHIPNFHDLSDQTIHAGETLRLRFRVSDADYDDLTVHLDTIASNGAQGAELNRLTTNVYELVWTPASDLEGDFQVGIFVDDGMGHAYEDITIHVLPVNGGMDGGTSDGGTGGTGGIDGGTTDGGMGGTGGLDGGTSDGGMGGTGGMDGGATDGGMGGTGGMDGGSGGTGGTDGGGPLNYNFDVLVMVENSTRLAAEGNGWDIPTQVARHFMELNAGFNNGQLAGIYNFFPIGIQYVNLDPSLPGYPPSVSSTPESEDLIILYDESYPLQDRYFSDRKTIVLKSPNLFSPTSPIHNLITHETGHFRGAFDLYAFNQEGFLNQVFLGAAYAWHGASYMGAGSDQAPIWDPLSIGLLNATAGDPTHDVNFTRDVIPGWEPSNIQLQVLDGDGDPVSGAGVDFYRSHYKTNLIPGDLCFSGVTDGLGRVTLPSGLTSSSISFYALFLGAIHVGSDTYLNWYDVTDIAGPYLAGETNLILNALVDSGTQYVPPPASTVDLEVTGMSFTPLSVAVGSSLLRRAHLRNNGPDPYVGNVLIQYYLSPDDVLDIGSDYLFGGYNASINLNSGESTIHAVNPSVPMSILPGAYYLIGKITPNEPGITDTDLTNQIGVSTTQVTILPSP